MLHFLQKHLKDKIDLIQKNFCFSLILRENQVQEKKSNNLERSIDFNHSARH